jgi:hypothetical protein
MALFSRKKTDQNVLPEIEKYYDAEKRERAGLAWLLAIVSIACVALVLIGLFFGGRWVYRKTTGTNKAPGVSTIQSPNTKTGIAKTPDTSVDTTTPSETPKTPATTPTTHVPSTPSVIPTPTPTPTPSPSTKTPTPTKPSTSTTPSTTTLVNTGPANTVAVFITATLGFALLHNIVSRSRRSAR